MQSLTDHRGPVHWQCSHRCQRRREIERGKPLFRFQIYNDVETIDHEGKQFPNLGAACQHVLGHSWGGTIALEYGARRPRELAGLVLASPLVSTRSWIADANALRGQLPQDVQAALSKCDPPAPITTACETATNVFYQNFNGREPRADAYNAYIAAHPPLGLNKKLYEGMTSAASAQ